MQRRVHVAIHHVRAAPFHVVDHAEDGLFVAGNDARTEHHGVAALDRNVLVIIHRHARERRHRLALGAGHENRDFLRRQAHHVLRAQQNAVGNIEQAERVRDLGHRNHASAGERHAAAVFLRQVEHQLDAVNGRAEARHHDAPLAAIEDLLHARPHRALALGVAVAVAVGRIGKQQQHAALAVVGQRMQVEQFVVGGGGIHLEIAGVDDDAEGRSDGESDGADNRVGDVDELDLERADFDDLLGRDLDQDGIALQVVLFQPPLDQRQREGRAIDRNVDIAEEIRDGADVVFVTVGEDDAADVSRVLLEESQVGHYQVYAQQLGLGEHHATIDDNDVLPVADGGHVHAELAQTAQGDYVQLVISHSNRDRAHPELSF